MKSHKFVLPSFRYEKQRVCAFCILQRVGVGVGVASLICPSGIFPGGELGRKSYEHIHDSMMANTN